MEFAEVLQSLGLNKNAARIVTYLKDVDRASSRNIETATGLRQPEVSIGTRTLREKGWIEESEVNGNGKGRPHKLNSMRTNIDEIIKHYEMQKMQEAAKTVEDIQRLKELSSA